jgi:hypothetical protein
MEKVINHVCQDLNQAVTIEINTDEVIVGVETEKSGFMMIISIYAKVSLSESFINC